MKINDPNLTAGSSGISGASGTSAPQRAGANGAQSAAHSGQTDDVHLSELVRSLRSLAADSPERQSKIEALARAYANGNYQVDAKATASAIIQDAIRR